MQRRADARFRGTAAIEFVVEGEIVARGALMNVSSRGLGVARLEPVSGRTFARGDNIVVQFELPTGRVIADGRIQWINVGQRELGIKMVAEATEQETLSRFLETASLMA
jgi:hypothetical protein